MDKAPTQPFDEVTAFHEAGHAVVALALDRPVQKVSAIPGQELLGRTRPRQTARRMADDELVATAAGAQVGARGIEARHRIGAPGFSLRDVGARHLAHREAVLRRFQLA